MCIPQLKLFPNPATETITIEAKAEFIGSNYTITDLTGRVLIKGLLLNEKSGINVSELSDGAYLFQSGAKYNLNLKIIKTHAK